MFSSVAAQAGHVEALKVSVSVCGVGFQAQRCTKEGQTCAHKAAQGGHVAVLEYIGEVCGSGVFFEADANGRTCVDLAREGRRDSALAFLEVQVVG